MQYSYSSRLRQSSSQPHIRGRNKLLRHRIGLLVFAKRKVCAFVKHRGSSAHHTRDTSVCPRKEKTRPKKTGTKGLTTRKTTVLDSSLLRGTRYDTSTSYNTSIHLVHITYYATKMSVDGNLTRPSRPSSGTIYM